MNREESAQTRKRNRADRREILEMLGNELAETIDLGLHVKQAAWNSSGAHSQECRTLLSELESELLDFADRFARRVKAIGGHVDGSPRIVADRSDLREHPTDLWTTQEHIAALLLSYSRYGRTTMRSLEIAQRGGDADTLSILQDLRMSIERALWFLEMYREALVLDTPETTFPEWPSAFPA